MFEQRDRKSAIENLLATERGSWVRGIRLDRAAIARQPTGAWALREAAKSIGVSGEEVDRLPSKARN